MSTDVLLLLLHFPDRGAKKSSRSAVSQTFPTLRQMIPLKLERATPYKERAGCFEQYRELDHFTIMGVKTPLERRKVRKGKRRKGKGSNFQRGESGALTARAKNGIPYSKSSIKPQVKHCQHKYARLSFSFPTFFLSFLHLLFSHTTTLALLQKKTNKNEDRTPRYPCSPRFRTAVSRRCRARICISSARGF